MKKITTAALLIGGAILASQSGLAQTDLYLGFQNLAGGASQNYIVNLGAAAGIVGATGVTDLSSAFSLSDFDTVLGSSSSLYGGVVGGYQTFPNTSSYVYLTQPSGSSTPPTLSASSTAATAGTIGGLNAPGTGTGTLDSTLSWQNHIEDQPNSIANSTFWGDSGINPDGLINGNGTTTLDLYYAPGGSAFTYQGYFTLDTTGGAGPSLTFTPAAVPEPATYALIGGGSLLLLSLRRRSFRKTA